MASTENPPGKISITKIASEQNFSLAVAAGLAAAIGSALLWAMVAALTQMKLGLMAIAVGYLVAKAIRITGKGLEDKFRYWAVACALLGCALGNFLSAVIFYAKANARPISDVLANMDSDLATRLMTANAGAMDLIFYGIAIFAAYRYSTQYKIIKHAKP